MNRVIKKFSKLPLKLQEEIYEGFSEGELARTSFPYQGNIVDGVIFQTEDTVYLIPLSTVIEVKSGSSADMDDDDDDDTEADSDDIDLMDIEDEG